MAPAYCGGHCHMEVLRPSGRGQALPGRTGLRKRKHPGNPGSLLHLLVDNEVERTIHFHCPQGQERCQRESLLQTNTIYLEQSGNSSLRRRGNSAEMTKTIARFSCVVDCKHQPHERISLWGFNIIDLHNISDYYYIYYE